VLKYMDSSLFEEDMLSCDTIDATVIFADICEFTKISETQPAEKVIKLLNEYFDVMVREIILQNGVVDKFIGDAVMAVFKGEDHSYRAIQTAINIKNAISSSQNVEEISDFKPQVSIGINSGEMLSGNIGCMSLKRFDYTVIGDAVNVAARLQGAAEKGQIIISESTYHGNERNFTFIDKDQVSLKNKSKPIKIYEVIK